MTPERRGHIAAGIAGLLVGVVGVIAVVIALFHSAGRSLPGTKQEETADLSAAVTQLRELNRMETATMRVIHVGTIRQSYRLVPDAFGGDEITLMAIGDVVAGIDLAQLHDGDVVRAGDGFVVIRLPPSQILVSRVDNSATHVIARKTGVFRRSDPDLEGRARQHAEVMIRAEAVREGILRTADLNGEKNVAALLHTLGFNHVRFIRANSFRLGRG